MEIITEHTNFEKNMGNIFYEIIKSFNDTNIKSIVEFAPGFRSKISYALEKIDFDGDLYIIDSNEEVLNYIKNVYSKIIPKANLILINKDINDCFNYLPSNIDLFLSNHCFDDMIIYKYIKTKKLESLFNNNIETYTLLNKYWLELNETELLDNLEYEVYKDIKNLFNNINFKYIIMNNYYSWFYFSINNIPEKNAFKIFNMIKNEFNEIIKIDNILNTINFISDEKLEGTSSLKDNILNPNNWIVGKYK